MTQEKEESDEFLDLMENEIDVYQDQILPKGFRYMFCGKKIKIKEIRKQQDAEAWVQKLSELTKITWRVAATYPHVSERKKNYLFKKKYRCQHCTFWNQKTSRKSKNTNCPARLTISVFNDPSKQDKKSDFWPCFVRFTADHNHAIDAPSTLRYRPLAIETKNAILDLFHRGHKPSSAYATFFAEKVSELGDNFLTYSSDRAKFPTKEDVKNLWRKEFQVQHKKCEQGSLSVILQEKLVFLLEQGHQVKMSILEEKYVVALCTPLMQRGHFLQTASDVVFITASGSCDKQKYKIYFLASCYEGVGGIPLGCIISNTTKCIALKEGLKIFLHDFKDVFLKHPSIIITDVTSNEQKEIKHFFPNSTLLLSSVHVLKECWQWLISKSHNIPKNIREQLFLKFKSMVYTENIAGFKKNEVELKLASRNYPHYIVLIENMMKYCNLWAHCYQREVVIQKTNTNNAVEIVFRVFKDVLLEHIRMFDLLQLVDFFNTTFDKYYTQRIMEMVHKRTDLNTLKIFCHNSQDVIIDNIAELPEGMYTVQTKSIDESYEVNMAVGYCSCHICTAGRTCKHQIAVVEFFLISDIINGMSSEVQKNLFWVASGKTAKEDDFISLKNSNVPVASDESMSVENDVCRQLPATYNLSDKNSDQHDEQSKQDVAYAHRLIDELREKLKAELVNDPKAMVPSIKKFVKNFKANLSNTDNLISHLRTAFSKSTQCLNSKKRKSLLKKRKNDLKHKNKLRKKLLTKEKAIRLCKQTSDSSAVAGTSVIRHVIKVGSNKNIDLSKKVVILQRNDLKVYNYRGCVVVEARNRPVGVQYFVKKDISNSKSQDKNL